LRVTPHGPGRRATLGWLLPRPSDAKSIPTDLSTDIESAVDLEGWKKRLHNPIPSKCICLTEKFPNDIIGRRVRLRVLTISRVTKFFSLTTSHTYTHTHPIHTCPQTVGHWRRSKCFKCWKCRGKKTQDLHQKNLESLIIRNSAQDGNGQARPHPTPCRWTSRSPSAPGPEGTAPSGKRHAAVGDSRS